VNMRTVLQRYRHSGQAIIDRWTAIGSAHVTRVANVTANKDIGQLTPAESTLAQGVRQAEASGIFSRHAKLRMKGAHPVWPYCGWDARLVGTTATYCELPEFAGCVARTSRLFLTNVPGLWRSTSYFSAKAFSCAALRRRRRESH
jgi:hypothetical protein